MMGKVKQPEGKVFLTQQSLNRAIKGVCDILRRSNCAGAMQYIPELTWILFLRILDEQETFESEKARSAGKKFAWSIKSPYRWQDWGSPYDPLIFHNPQHHKPYGWKRHELGNKGEGSLLEFINKDLLPYLKNLGGHPKATPRQKIIGEIASSIEHTQIDTEYNLNDVLNRIHQINIANIDSTHIFPISQIYEGLLLEMGQKSNDGGQFFTPREIIRAMVRVVAPQPCETIYDPCCGTGGFIAQAYEYIKQTREESSLVPNVKRPDKNCSFYGREKENLVYPIALANLVLHGIDEPHIWHGNTLTKQEIYGGLFKDAPSQFDVIMTNPPFGGKENKKAQDQFFYKSSSTQLLFLQHVIDSLSPKGRCGIVVDEGILFRTTDTAFVQTKRRLLETCDLWCIVSLPIGAFINAGASIKTDIFFFTKGKPTERIWYYDLSDIKISKATPLTSEHFDEFFQLLPKTADSGRSWSVTRKQIEKNGYDLKAVNPNFRIHHDDRSLSELLRLIEEGDREIQSSLQELYLYTPRNGS
jgi:type I restriction enzyme M protein